MIVAMLVAGLGLAGYALAGMRAAQRRAGVAEALAQQMEELYLASQDKIALQGEEMLRLDRQYHHEAERADKLAAANEVLRDQLRQLRQAPGVEAVRMLARWRFSRN